MNEDVLQVHHRHVIFTIDEGLRDVFLLHRHLLKDLMDEAAKLLTDFFKKKANRTSYVWFENELQSTRSYAGNDGGIDRKGRMETVRFPAICDAAKTMADRCIKTHSERSRRAGKEKNSAKATKGLLKEWGRLLGVCPKTEGEGKGAASLYWPLYSSTSDWNQSYRGL